MKIDNISIFGEYKLPENRVTAAFLQICKVGGEDFIRFTSTQLNISIPSSDIEIQTQVTGEETIPDGLLESNFSFRLFVESKIRTNSIDKKQLDGHRKQIVKATDVLLYITPDLNKPDILGSTNWASWVQINNIFNDYLQTFQSESKQLLEFLVMHFNRLLENLDLLGSSWDLGNDNVLIVAGSWAEGIAINYNYYICQNRRAFRSARYIAFYNLRQIRYLFEITEIPEDDVDLSKHSKFTKYLQQAETNYQKDLRKVFSLKKVKDIGPIINDTIDKNGNSCPYTYGQPRYTTLAKIQTATRTSQL